MPERITIARQFGAALDKDDYAAAHRLLHPECLYDMGETTLTGPKAIVGSYEQNMLEGRAKMDELVWGDSTVSTIDAQTFEVHFTDYLTHKGQQHIHRCKQQIIVDEHRLITKITHINLPGEPEALQAFYQRVGIPTKK